MIYFDILKDKSKIKKKRAKSFGINLRSISHGTKNGDAHVRITRASLELPLIPIYYPPNPLFLTNNRNNT